MTTLLSATATSGGLTVKAYSGDKCVMLAFDLDDHKTDLLAGFAIARRLTSSSKWTILGNRLSFEGVHTDPALSDKGKFFPSTESPFQKFWWVDFPPEDQFGEYEYQVTVRRFTAADSTDLADDQQVKLNITVQPFKEGEIEVAFTRGYLSSQAYADKFDNAPYRPSGQVSGWDFDTSGLQAQWQWLGGHARQTVIDFLIDCRDTPGATLDAFVFDFNEPDIIRALVSLAPKVRILADNSKDHAPGSAADLAFKDIIAAGGSGMQGHFGRLQHNKIFIKRVDGVATKVLTGSTNFSITGLYVNANHIVVFDNPAVAGQYATMFDAAFSAELTASRYEHSAVSQREFTFTESDIPRLVISYAPHKHPTFSLDTLLANIKGAQSSVIFAVMELDGKSEVLSTLKALHNDANIFSYGISDSRESADDTVGGTTVFTPKTKFGELIYSKENPEKFPAPFAQELQVTGAFAHVIHHKFVVVDFNGDKPVVYCGSSNLAEGGEESNGDNLIAIYDKAIATAFAIEGIRLVDHYAFAAAVKAAGDTQTPLRLKTDAEKWWAAYYEDGSIRQTERKLFVR